MIVIIIMIYNLIIIKPRMALTGGNKTTLLSSPLKSHLTTTKTFALHNYVWILQFFKNANKKI
jgi:hypothetical protein